MDNNNALRSLISLSNELLLLLESNELSIEKINEVQTTRDNVCHQLFSQSSKILSILDQTLLQEFIALDQQLLTAANEKKADMLKLALNQKMNTKALKAYK